VNKKKDLRQRLGIAIIGIPVLLYIFYTGGLALFIFLGLLCIMGMWEFSNLMGSVGLLGRIIDILVSLSIYFAMTNTFILTRYHGILFIITAVLIGIRFIHQNLHKTNFTEFKDYLLTIIGWLYTGFFSGLIFLVWKNHTQKKYLVLLLVLIWITDSAAYFIGMKFGRHRGIFRVSPRKSLEGFVAGLVAPFIASTAIYLGNNKWSLQELIFVTVCAGIFGQIGDLVESKFKRLARVKDSSDIIPGHGGVLDRFDSLLVAGPVLYLILRLFP
jgi:phosphatidate cytidylyltransferase